MPDMGNISGSLAVEQSSGDFGGSAGIDTIYTTNGEQNMSRTGAIHNAMGDFYSGLPTMVVKPNYTAAEVQTISVDRNLNLATLGAVIDLTSDVLAGTVPAHDLSILVNAKTPLQFVAQNTLQVGVGPGAWDYNAPTPIAHTTTSDIAYSNYHASLADWGVVIAAALGLAGTAASVAAGGATAPAVLGFAATLVGVGASDAFRRVESDLRWGLDLSAAHGNANIAMSMMHAGGPL